MIFRFAKQHSEVILLYLYRRLIFTITLCWIRSLQIRKPSLIGLLERVTDPQHHVSKDVSTLEIKGTCSALQEHASSKASELCNTTPVPTCSGKELRKSLWHHSRSWQGLHTVSWTCQNRLCATQKDTSAL